MNEGVLAIIWIGGQVDESCVEILIDAINETPVYTHDGDTCYKPTCADDLFDALTSNGHLYLCDDNAPSGEMPAIMAACQTLDLSYRLWREADTDRGSTVTFWSPGLERSLTFGGEHMHPETTLIDSTVLVDSLKAIQEGRAEAAQAVLASVVSEVAMVPPLTCRSEASRRSTYQRSEMGCG